jgi:transposase
MEAHPGLILDAYKATPDITLAELQALLADHGTEVALGTIWRFFARRGITRKKAAHATEQDRPDILKRGHCTKVKFTYARTERTANADGANVGRV